MTVHGSHKGFTLVELMVALAILSGTLSIAFSMMLTYQDAVIIQRREIAVVQQSSRALEDMVDGLRAVKNVTFDDAEPNYVRFQIPVNPEDKGFLDENRDIRWGAVYAGEVFVGGWCTWRFIPKTEDGQEVLLDENQIGYDINLDGSATDVFVLGKLQASYYDSDDPDAPPVGTHDITSDMLVWQRGDPKSNIFRIDSPVVVITLAAVDTEAAVPLVISLSSTVECQNKLNDSDI